MRDISKDVELIYDNFNDTLIITRIDMRSLSKSGRILGYCNKHKGIYRVVYPITGDDNLDNMVKMHEYGHIYLGHLEGIHEELDENLVRIIKKKDSQLIDLVNKNCEIDYADKILDRVVYDPMFNHMVHNVAMDLEVNSVILGKDDLDFMTKRMNELVFKEFLDLVNNGNGKMPSTTEMSNLISKFDMKFMHPSEFGFESELSYPDYLVLLILNLDKLVRLLSNKSKSSELGKNGEEKSNNSSSEGEDSQQGSPSGKSPENKNIPQTFEEFEEMVRNSVMSSSDDNEGDGNGNNQSDSSEGGSENNQGSSKSDSSGDKSDEENSDSSKGNNKSEGDNDDKDQSSDHGSDSRDKADDRKKNDLGNCSISNGGGSGRGLGRSSNVRDYVVNEDPLTMSLKEILRDVRHKVIKRDFSKDMTQKYNRRVLGDSKLLSPTYRQKITRSENPTVAFFVDVSGSMNSGLVDRIITTIRNGMNSIDRSLKYSLITWDIELCEYHKDIDINTPIPKISCGGGTNLSGTFDLFKKDFGKDAIMVIISDFGDNLDRWHEKESNMNGYSMYGLKYGNDTWYNGGVQPDWKNFKVRQCD